MADYDINHITKLGHLQKLAQKENQKANALATRLDALERVGAQANKIESIKVNGTAQTIASDKSVNITVPTKTSQLANDSTFQTSAQVVATINTAISKSGHASFQKVDAVPKVDAAQENILYLVMNTTTKHYDIYAKIKGDGDSYTMELLDDTTVDLSGKVDKVAGKGLSTNDYTTAEKTKLAGIEEGANEYVHPSHTAATSGLYKITVDALGHVIAVTKVTKEDITGLGIPDTNTTYGLASTTANGLMSKEDYAKLNGMVLATDTEVDAMLTEVFGS
jgi:post-segregation antitoxin (ccd killing protein)